MVDGISFELIIREWERTVVSNWSGFIGALSVSKSISFGHLLSSSSASTSPACLFFLPVRLQNERAGAKWMSPPHIWLRKDGIHVRASELCDGLIDNLWKWRVRSIEVSTLRVSGRDTMSDYLSHS
ncbi:hypothetical protein ALC56_08500 [Trachymyrmex septentrionalis]|uniref:Uncharacterized protein n=1 Tax=Trachymyrmex septentrionalis TaxID=34720 RepID=A0A195F9I2_9HYME|nr:hypothetical protein ALC56_08500 [Trachymyrmex septentrionalis]